MARVRFGTLSLAVMLAAFAAAVNAADEEASTANPKTLVMGYPVASDSYAGTLLTLIYGDAFSRMGIRVRMLFCPPGRCTLDLNTGRLDGELARGRCYGDWHPHLVRVEESPMPPIQFVAYVTRPGMSLDQLKARDNPDFMIGLWRGTPETERFASHHFPRATRVLVRHTGQGLRMLAAGRFDIYAGVALIAERLLADPVFGNSQIYGAGVLGQRTVHTFLAPQHRALAPRLARTLREMKDEGAIALYLNEAWKQTDAIDPDRIIEAPIDPETLHPLLHCADEKPDTR